MTSGKGKRLADLSPRDRIDVVLAEYNALYGLAEFRMASLDRRVPAAGVALVAFVASVPAMPNIANLIFLVFVPASLIWFVRTTINHARSFEDLIRRIEQLEGKINAVASEELVGFQSTHPSRGMTVGGRTGFETVQAVGLVSALLLGACFFIGYSVEGMAAGTLIAYAAYLTFIAAYVLFLVRRWREYRYAQQSSPDRTMCKSVRAGKRR